MPGSEEAGSVRMGMNAMKFMFLMTLSWLGAEVIMPLGAAESAEYASGPEKVPLLELYSSEGCSSCPPAETWFSRLRSEPTLWKEFVPVAFHVTYWDHLGWRDLYGKEIFDRRQRAYARIWNESSVYTPGLVWNARPLKEWAHYRAPPRNDPSPAGRLTVQTADGTHLKIRFAPSDRAPKRWTAHAALLGFGLVSNIKRGENAGLKMQHDFTALDYEEASLAETRNGWETEIELVLPPEAARADYGVAVWVSREGEIESVQAVGGETVPRTG